MFGYALIAGGVDQGFAGFKTIVTLVPHRPYAGQALDPLTGNEIASDLLAGGAFGLLESGASSAARRRWLRRTGNSANVTKSTASSAITRATPSLVRGKFRGEPFAYGTGTRSARATALVEDAAKAAKINLDDYVDKVRYWRGAPKFDVINGRRILFIGEETFGKTRAGQLIDALHEVGHAQVFAKRVENLGWERAVEETFWGKYAYGGLYFHEEQVVERLARLRAARHLGGLSPQQYGASTRYLERARQQMLDAQQELFEAGIDGPSWPYKIIVDD